MNETQHLDGPDLGRGVAQDQLTEGQPLLGHIDGEAVILVRHGTRIDAVSATCTHYGGPLAEGVVDGERVYCPWHHACFSLRDGRVLGAPGLNPLRCYTVEEHDGRVFATVPRTPPRPALPPRNPTSVLIVGAGAAGEAAATELRRAGYAGSITLLAAEPDTPIDRPNLSKDYLAGKVPSEWLPLRGAEYWQEQNIRLLPGARATALDTAAHRVMCSDGRRFEYAVLLLATGAQPIRLPIPGADAAHVHVLRSLADTQAILTAIERGARRAVVIGASFIGLEVAAALRARAIEVHVVAPETRPLQRVFGARLADHLRGVHEALGTVFHLGRKPAAIHAHAVELDDGALLPADLVVMGVGVRPDIALAEQAGLRIDNGIVVDRYLATSVADVWAAGDVANWPDARGGQRQRIEHWALAQAQGKAAARNLLGFAEPFLEVPFFWSQHGDLTLSYVGHATHWDALEEEGDPASGNYLCRYLLDGSVRAVVSIGRDRDSLRAQIAMRDAVSAS